MVRVFFEKRKVGRWVGKRQARAGFRTQGEACGRGGKRKEKRERGEEGEFEEV
jgi:hypothetical protein